MIYNYLHSWYFNWLRWLAGLLLLVLVAYRPAGAQCLPAAGCRPGSAPPNSLNLGFGIMRVQLANVDTTTNGAGDGYQDYGCRRAIRLDRGTTYTLRVTTGLQADEQVRAWADFNQDGVFDPLREEILSSVGRAHLGSFTLPATLAPGTSLRLRIAADYVNAPAPGPCTTPQYSQTQDYRILVTPASPPRPVGQFAAADSVTCSGTVHLRDRSRNNPTSWHWDFGDGTSSTQQHPSHFYPRSGAYTIQLRVCNASGCDSLTKPAYVRVLGDGPKPITCQPTTLAYCCDFGLTRVHLAELDHAPGGGAAGYQDASCANRATLRADWPDTLRLTTGGQAAHDVRVYLDLNNDGQLDPTTELLYQGLSVKNPAIPLRLSSLTPGLVYNTTLRLRICADYAGSPAVGPCAAPNWGQVADYAVQLVPNTLVPHAAFRLTYTQTCGPVKVRFTNTSVGSATYRWDFGDGTTSTATTPPPHTYSTPGGYSIKLVAVGPVKADSTRQETAVAAACPTYCTSEGWGGNEDSPVYFTRAKLADLDNQELRGPRVGYRDFTQHVATVRQGQTLELRTESLPFSSGGSGPWVESGAWIDYNQDGQFGPSERVATGTGYSPYLATVHIPANAAVGATRLRLLIYVLNSSFYSNTCSPAPYSLSATEDYTVLVLPAQTAPLSGFTADQLASCSGQVQFRDTTAYAPTAWHWTFGDGSTSTSPNPLHTYTQTGTYSVTLQTQNGYGTSTTSQAQYITVTGTSQGPHPVVLPVSSRQLCCENGISQAQLATLSYLGGERQPGYRDETCAQPVLHLTAGSSYPVSVKRTARVVYNAVYLWLDANDNGLFEAQEQLYKSGSSTQEVNAGSFVIPMTALRDRPLRLRLFWHGLRYDDGKNSLVVPNPQIRDEDYDQVRDFTVWVGSTPLATLVPTAPHTWSCYPNPTTGLLTLTGITTSSSVQVMNTLGQLAGCFPTVARAGGLYQVDVHTLPKGLYIMRLNGVVGTMLVTLE